MFPDIFFNSELDGEPSFQLTPASTEYLNLIFNLSEIELQRLNLLVSQFLDFAELQALEQRTMKMQDWVEELDNQILLNRRKILEGHGKILHEEAIKKAEKEFQIYREREMKELQSDFDLLMKSLPNNKDENK